MTSLLELDARLSNRMRVAEKPGALRNIAVVLAHSGDSWFWGAALILILIVLTLNIGVRLASRGRNLR